ncbi:MAG: hypothetical protein MUE40_07455 [Anaerolineae bacterium]|jgi:membrane-bound serine protease (ClpP class)|nr:hypothetical protein [Anaerolineae bacterium]
MIDLLNPATLDPTLVYLGLLAGLWLALTAAHLAGTGILEIAAFVVLAGSVYALTLLPTSWGAVFLLVLGAGCFMVVPYISPRLARWSEIGLIFQGLGGWLLFYDRAVSPWIIGVTLLLAWAYNRFVLLPVLRSHQNAAGLDVFTVQPGARGRVVSAVDPVGTVNVNSEMWTARSRASLPAGTEIVVVEKRGLELLVEKAKREEKASFATNGTHDSP